MGIVFAVMPILSTKGSDQPAEDFEALVESHQIPLRAFIMSLVADPHATSDILQETNLVAWRKASDFKLGTNFRAWAFRIAHFQVLAHRQRNSRSRLVFNDDILDLIAAESMDEDSTEIEDRSHRLRLCLSKLPDPQRELLRRRYLENEGVTSIATDLGKSPNAISQALHRARHALLGCMVSEGSSSDHREIS